VNARREPLTPPEGVCCALRSEGHLLRELPVDLDEFDGGFLMRALIDTGAMATLLKETSPRIKAQWLATATALRETGR